MKKKFLSIALALVLALSMGTVAFAVGDDGYDGKLNQQPIVNKTYTINHGTAPAETFEFKFEGKSYKDGNGNLVDNANIPPINNVSIPFDATDETVKKNTQVAIDANNYQLGVYTYEVTEVEPTTKTAGVSYSTEKLYLVLTILRDENSGKHYVAAMHYESANSADKTTGFTNTYDAGSLKVAKKVAGNMADTNKEFTFTITFQAPSGTEIKTNQIQSDAETGSWNGLTYTIRLRHNAEVNLSNIPAGTTYTVTEDYENYTSDDGDFSDTTKTIAGGDNDTVTFTNTLTSEVDMGVFMDSMPYVLLLAVVGVGAIVFFTKKKREN